MKESYIDYQNRFDVRCEWGPDAIENLYVSTDVFVIVDVLSFSTCVEIAIERGASILPYRFKDDSAKAYSEEHNAELAVHRSEKGSFSLSPASMLKAKKGQRIVLPSPNGATLSLLTKEKITLIGCLRNAKAVAHAAQNLGKVVTIVASGERWPNGNLRFALEDALGAGAIISYMAGKLSPEAEAFQLLFKQFKPRLTDIIADCTSGNELLNRDFQEDVALASMLNVSSTVPILKGNEYTSIESY